LADRGDFNEILHSTEKVGGSPMDASSAVQFQDAVDSAGLLEMNHSGDHLTWCNGQEGVRRIYKRLDRCLCNTAYLHAFDSRVTYLTRVHSDHSPMLVCESESARSGPSPFFQVPVYVDHTP